MTLCAFCRTAPATTQGLFFNDPSCQPCRDRAGASLARAELVSPPTLLPPDDGRDHFNTGEDDWDRDADSRAADRELGDE